MIVTAEAANSGAAYVVAAPTHLEKRLLLTLTANCALTLTGGTYGEVCAIQLHLKQDGTGARTVTWPGNVDWGLTGPPTLSTTAGKTDHIYLSTEDGGAAWRGVLAGVGY